MNKNYKPPRNNAVSPYLMVEGVEREIAFITAVFGGEVIETPKLPDGKVFHAEIKIDDSVIMIGRASADFPALKGNLYIYVESVDSVFDIALEHGAKTIMKPADRFYGNREGGILDPQGNQWWLAQVLRVMTEEDITKGHPGRK